MGGLFRVGVCILYGSTPYYSHYQPPCLPPQFVARHGKKAKKRLCVDDRTRFKKKKKEMDIGEEGGGGIFSAGRILLTLAFGKDFYSFYKAFSVPPSPNWAAHGGHLPYTFCLLPTPPTGSIVPTPLSREMPPVFYCKLPSDHLFLSSVTARQPSFASPMGPVFSPSIVMPVVKNSDPIVDFPFFFLSSSSSIP